MLSQSQPSECLVVERGDGTPAEQRLMVSGDYAVTQVLIEKCELEPQCCLEPSGECRRRFVAGLDGFADADVNQGTLVVSHLVPERNRNHERSRRAEGNPGRAGAESNGRTRRQQVALWEEPERSAWALAQQRRCEGGDSTGSRERGRRRAKASDATEERVSLELRALHDPVPIAPEQVMREMQRDDRVPPGAMIEQCDRGARGVRPLRATDIDAREIAAEKTTSVSRVQALDDDVLAWR